MTTPNASSCTLENAASWQARGNSEKLHDDEGSVTLNVGFHDRGLVDGLLAAPSAASRVLRFPLHPLNVPIRKDFKQQGWISLEIGGLVM
jgi:hypothetical protein